MSRHCERSEAIQKTAKEELDCFVASLLAMTDWEKASRMVLEDAR